MFQWAEVNVALIVTDFWFFPVFFFCFLTLFKKVFNKYVLLV